MVDRDADKKFLLPLGSTSVSTEAAAAANSMSPFADWEDLATDDLFANWENWPHMDPFDPGDFSDLFPNLWEPQEGL
jgi:hypothetical protein